MARKRIFARKRTSRWPLAVALSLALAGLVTIGGLGLLRSEPEIPACSAEEVRRDLREMLREHPAANGAAEVEVMGLSERRRVFRRDEMLARDCAASAQLDGAEEMIRFRITRDHDRGYVLTLGDA